jgi:phage terminase small subunit
MSKKKPSKKEQFEELFCLEYLKDLNATAAYQRARPDIGYNTARTEGSKLLAKPNIQQQIYKLNEERKKAIKIDSEFVLNELYRIASTDVIGLFNDDGSVKPIQEVPEDLRRAVSSIEVLEYFEGYGDDREQVGFIKKIRLWSKDSSLDKLGKHLKLFTEKREISASKSLEEILSKSYQDKGEK